MTLDTAIDWISVFADQRLVLSLILFALAFVNVFLPPVPIETISLFAGYLSGLGHGDAFLMWVALTAGMATGSTVLFYITRKYGHRLLRLPLVSGWLTPSRMASAEQWFARYGSWAIYAGKLVPSMSLATVFASGLLAISPRSALVAIYISNVIYFGLAVALGQALGENWRKVLVVGKRLGPLVLVLVMAGLIAVTYSRYRARVRRRY